MKYILRNIRSLIKNEPLIFAVMIVCVFASSWVLTFAYGLYQNYNVQKTEADIEGKELRLSLCEGKSVTRTDLERFFAEISDETLNAANLLYCDAELPGFPTEPGYKENFGRAAFRFTIHNGQYQSSSYIKEIWEERGQITSGRFFSDDDEKNGANVAMVYTDMGKWNEATLAIRTGENTIRLFDKEYEIIGTYNSFGGTPLIPFLSIPENLELSAPSFMFEKNLTKSQYEEIRSAARIAVPETFVFPDLAFPDSENIYIYNNILLICALIAVLTVINFASLYNYIISKRIRQLAVFKLCGCTSFKATGFYLAECAIICVPVFMIGTVSYIPVMKFFLSPIFPYMEAAYSPIIYTVIFALYIIILVIIMSFTLIRSVKKNTVAIWKEGAL